MVQGHVCSVHWAVDHSLWVAGKQRNQQVASVHHQLQITNHTLHAKALLAAIFNTTVAHVQGSLLRCRHVKHHLASLEAAFIMYTIAVAIEVNDILAILLG